MINSKLKLNSRVESFENYAPEGVYLGEKSMKVIELIHGLVWELTFHGGREDKDKLLKELDSRMDDIKSGKMKTHPWSEIRERLKKKFKLKEEEESSQDQ